MAAAAVDLLSGRLRGGVVIAPGAKPVAPLDAIAAGHPIPDAGSERAGRRALEIAATLAEGERLLVLLSGGASALMAVPAEGLSLEDKRRTTATLLRAGADIHALNTVRKHLSAIKGGQLAARARGRLRALVISDVVGDDLSVIASGPTVPDASTFADARQILERYGGAEAYPQAVVARLDRGRRGEIAETPKPGDSRIAGATTEIIGGRANAMRGAAERAAAFGYAVVQIDAAVVGEARDEAVAYVKRVAAIARQRTRLCVVSSGETTVHVRGTGSGGRNQEFALAAAATLGSAGEIAALASVGTDGIDGPTDAAGAIVDTTTLARARAAGLDPGQFLADNNAYAFFDALGDLIRTGPTDTNVGDLQVLLLA
jgi:hydroxypyruvate reductase